MTVLLLLSNDAITMTGAQQSVTSSEPFSVVYDAETNGDNVQILSLEIPASAATCAFDVTVDFTMAYTIDPTTPFDGISWTAETSFMILTQGGDVLTAEGPDLPGSANTGDPISGTVSGTFSSSGPEVAAGLVLTVFDSFNDSNEDGTFSGTLDYTTTVVDNEISCAPSSSPSASPSASPSLSASPSASPSLSASPSASPSALKECNTLHFFLELIGIDPECQQEEKQCNSLHLLIQSIIHVVTFGRVQVFDCE